jgi:hypothetical protein
MSPVLAALILLVALSADPPTPPHHPSGVIAFLGPRTVPRAAGPSRPLKPRVIVFFDYAEPETDGSSVSPDARATLAKHAKLLKGSKRVTLVGRSDEFGTFGRNQVLAQRRVALIEDYLKNLVAGLQIDVHLAPVERKPIPNAVTDERCSYYLNRAVDIIIED